MSESSIPLKFLMWILRVAVALGLLGQLGAMTYKAAEAAIEAHQKDQMSYGKFSRQLWVKPTKRKQ